MATLRHQPFLHLKGSHCLHLRASSKHSTYGTLGQKIPQLSTLILAKLSQGLSNMSSRVSTGARPGARFAQFKLVLLGSYILPLAGSPES